MDILELFIAVLRAFSLQPSFTQKEMVHGIVDILSSEVVSLQFTCNPSAEASIISSHLAVKFQHSRLGPIF